MEYVKINPMPIRIVFMGSPDFAAKILSGLAANYPISGVFTQPDRESGRGKTLTPPPVKEVAAELQIPIFQPTRLKNPESFESLESLNPDVIIVAAYGQILRQNVLDLPKFGCINIHASYLPRWRGAAPIQAAILAGDEYTGVSIMKMDAGIDTGPVLAQKKVKIDSQETAISLEQKLAHAGIDLVLETLPSYFAGQLDPLAQPEEGSTYAGLLKKQDGLLDFSRPATQLERMIRAYDDWPGTFMMIDQQIIKIRHAGVVNGYHLTPGERAVQEDYPVIGTAEGILVLHEVQPAGKKWMTGSDFLRGYSQLWIKK
jgi:methionyl-tRNA formyltransferase